jgi:hypothetical protein
MGVGEVWGWCLDLDCFPHVWKAGVQTGACNRRKAD